MTMENLQEHPVLQQLRWGDISQKRFSPADTLFVATGRRIFVLGDIDGQFRPRSNPYDIYAFGHPHPDDPLANKLQGVWAQPVKGLSQYGYVLTVNGEPWSLNNADRFTQCFDSVSFEYHHGDLHAERCDFAAQDLPVLFSSLTLENTGTHRVLVQVAFEATFDLSDAWFTQLSSRRNSGQTVSVEQGCLVARAEVAPQQWAAVVGGAEPAEAANLRPDARGELVYSFALEPATARTLSFGMAVESQAGAPAALALLAHALTRRDDLLAERQAQFAALFADGPRFSSPDAGLNTAFDLARANMQILEAEAPRLGRYFYAGLEMFPFWFSNDGAYSTMAMFASRLPSAGENHVRIGARYSPDGRVPHQISPSGKIVGAGNAQETPLWVMSVWDAYCWTGDRAFLQEVYPAVLQGMFAYVLGAIDPDGDGYPSGPGIIEVNGMGEEKLDSAAYTWAALRAVRAMAETLGDEAHLRQAQAWIEKIEAHFEEDWWDPSGGCYAMSLLDPGNARYAVPFWAIIVPLEVGLASPEHAAAMFTLLREQYIDSWGLQHTAGHKSRIWTLPTGTLSRAAYRYGENELGFEMLHHLADTLGAGSIGLFHELIPEGACIIQLWSAALMVRGVVEDLLGIRVQAAEGRVVIAPHLPADWSSAALENLVFGPYRLRITVTPGWMEIENRSMEGTLQVAGCFPNGEEFDRVLAAGETRRVETAVSDSRI